MLDDRDIVPEQAGGAPAAPGRAGSSMLSESMPTTATLAVHQHVHRVRRSGAGSPGPGTAAFPSAAPSPVCTSTAAPHRRPGSPRSAAADGRDARCARTMTIWHVDQPLRVAAAARSARPAW